MIRQPLLLGSPSVAFLAVRAYAENDVDWSHTPEKTSDPNWQSPTFDASSWKQGPSGFGKKEPVRAEWRTNCGVEGSINGSEAFTEDKALDGYDAVRITSQRANLSNGERIPSPSIVITVEITADNLSMRDW